MQHLCAKGCSHAPIAQCALRQLNKVANYTVFSRQALLLHFSRNSPLDNGRSSVTLGGIQEFAQDQWAQSKA
jgi:hypothetical protein